MVDRGRYDAQDITLILICHDNDIYCLTLSVAWCTKYILALIINMTITYKRTRLIGLQTILMHKNTRKKFGTQKCL